MSNQEQAAEIAQRRYDRIAPFYDFLEGIWERSRARQWRELLWRKTEGSHILEVGIGTGKNFPYYPPQAKITAIDFSEKMLQRARDKASRLQLKVHLEPMDVQKLMFSDNTFDTIVASFAFCSVPDPIRGLKEVERVCKAGGKVVLLEHVLSKHRIVGFLMNLVNPLVVRMVGANINRRTEENITKSGLIIEQVTDLGASILKLIEARKKTRSS